tara:strand:+ start:3455 stop:4186 length:732 start_codon:yes stop_codon:yes gene_type:complete
MAVGLIKKQIIHTANGSKSVSPFKGRLRNRLEDAEKAFKGEMQSYKDFTFKNPYAQNVYAGMENTAEDLTINQKAANFQAQQAQQGQANILSSLQAGGGFNAGNIQALANQAQTGAQQAAASIGQQESANQRMAAQQAARNQQMERQGRLQVQQGAAKLQQMEFDRQATQLGMSMQMVGNAQDAIAANKAMWGSIIGGVTGMIGDLGAGGLTDVISGKKKIKVNGGGGDGILSGGEEMTPGMS